jgi:hypothetical protein
MCPRNYTRNDNLKRHISVKHEGVIPQVSVNSPSPQLSRAAPLQSETDRRLNGDKDDAKATQGTNEDLKKTVDILHDRSFEQEFSDRLRLETKEEGPNSQQKEKITEKPLGPQEPMPSSPLMDGSFSRGSHTVTSSVGVGFSQDQIPAAQAIAQFIAEHPGETIPSHLITDPLVEISNGYGYCLIGNCGVEYTMQKCNEEKDTNKGTASRKRADRLYDHIRDVHFNCRLFRCGQWYVLYPPSLPSRLHRIVISV